MHVKLLNLVTIGGDDPDCTHEGLNYDPGLDVYPDDAVAILHDHAFLFQ